MAFLTRSVLVLALLPLFLLFLRFVYKMCMTVHPPIAFFPLIFISIDLIVTKFPSLPRKLMNFLWLKNEDGDHILNQILEDFNSIQDEASAAAKTGAESKEGYPRHKELSPAGSSSRPYFGGTGETVVVGLDRDLKDLKERFDGLSTLQVIPVVGVGGIGKTTLVKQVYENYASYGFDLCAWTTVSHDHSPSQVILDLFKSAKLPTEHMNGELGDHLLKSLRGKRYLVVMDDVWELGIWDEVKRFLPNDENRSCVLLTTRSTEVARYASSGGSLHWMHYLLVDESRRLLNNIVFDGADCPSKLKGILDEITQSCRGLPLALVVVGGLLSKMERTEENWMTFADSLKSIGRKDDECMEILSLSYYHLPHHLRPCFLYMGMFPKDYEVPVTKLMQLWLAEGFLQRPDNFKSPEVLAEEYLEDLVQRNLILTCRRNYLGKIKQCKIHDVLRKLCLREARKEKFLLVINRQKDVRKGGLESYRRLIIQPSILKIHMEVLHDKAHSNSSRMHSLLCFRERDTNLYLEEPERNMKLNGLLQYRILRVLDLLIMHLSMFPLEVSNLVCLRYLALAFSGALHPYISRLKNLHTIVHRDKLSSHKDSMLPVEIWMMPNLRHLHVPATGLCSPPSYWANSSTLQTLVEAINLSFGIQILDKIRGLKKLAISYNVKLKSFKGWSEHKLQNLTHVTQLESLKLSVFNYRLRPKISYPTDLAFPDLLRKLTLRGCRIPWERLTIAGKLPNLEVLKLRHNACKGDKWEPVEEQFGQLKYLELQHMDLEHWIAKATHFPSLHLLLIKSCDHLEEIPSDIGETKTLKRIELVNCHPRVVTSAEKIQKEMGRLDLKVSAS